MFKKSPTELSLSAQMEWRGILICEILDQSWKKPVTTPPLHISLQVIWPQLCSVYMLQLTTIEATFSFMIIPL